MKINFSFIIYQTLRLITLAGVFCCGYLFTDRFFRMEKIPYPFEFFGVAAGLGLSFWALAILGLFEKQKSKPDPEKGHK